MCSNPEQEWAGEVALAFELKVWGCVQLFTAPWASYGERNGGGSELQGDLAQHFSKEQAGVLAGCCTASGHLHCRADAKTQRDTVILALLAVVLLSAAARG